MGIFIILLLISLDQYTKYLTIEHLKNENSIEVIEKIIGLTYVENTGAAFSMLEGQIVFFVIVTISVLGYMYFYYKSGKIQHIIGKIAVILISAGAIGNLIDRLLYGFVVDMIELLFINFAIFNIADIFITFGGIFAGIYILFLHKEEISLEKGTDLDE